MADLTSGLAASEVGGPPVRVDVWEIQDRRKRGTAKPWIVRWAVNGEGHSLSFSNKAKAEAFRSSLQVADRNPKVVWNLSSGQPDHWTPKEVPTVADCARALVQEDSAELADKSLRSLAEALIRFIEATAVGSPDLSDDERKKLRRQLQAWLRGIRGSETAEAEAWIVAWSPRIDSMTTDRLRAVDRALQLRLDGSKNGDATYHRYRSGATKCLTYAVEEGLIDGFTWPRGSVGRSRRKKVKAAKVKRQARLANLPNREQVAQILSALDNHRPESRRYRAMSAVAVYGGLRPSEVVVLEVSDIRKARKGGRPFIDVTKAWTAAGGGWTDPGDEIDLPKTGQVRKVFIPEMLRVELQEWCKFSGITEGPMFLTENGRPPLNWDRALRTACAKVNLTPVTPYGLRHTNATLQMEAGVPLGVIAEQLGNSIDVLVNHYLGWLQGSQEAGRDKFDAYLSEGVPSA